MDVIAASAGVRSYYRAMGLPMPQLPVAEADQTLGAGMIWDGMGPKVNCLFFFATNDGFIPQMNSIGDSVGLEF